MCLGSVLILCDIRPTDVKKHDKIGINLPLNQIRPLIKIGFTPKLIGPK